MKTIQIDPVHLNTFDDMNTEQGLEAYRRQRYGEVLHCQYASPFDKLTDLIYFAFHRKRNYPIN